jgi:hypothetical protein
MTDAASTPTVKPLGLLARIIGVITAPKATFENVVAAPRPAGMLLLVALVIGLGTVAPQFTETGRQKMVDMQVKAAERIADLAGRPMPPEAYASIEARSRSVGWRMFGVINPLIGLPIWALFIAALYWAAFNIVMGGTATFKQVLAIVTHSQVIGALGMIAALPIYAMGAGAITMSGPFNLGALAPMLEEGSTLATFLGSISVFSLWGFIVTGIGLGVLYKRSGRNIAIGLILAYLLIAYGIISLFGSFLRAA